MGQTLSTIVGYLLIYIYKLQEKYNEYFKQEDKKDYGKDILLKDDGQRASKDIIIFRYFIKS